MAMPQQLSMEQQIAQSVTTFVEQRLGRKTTSVTVALGGNSLVIAMHGVLSPGEQVLAANPAGAAPLQQFHQQLFQRWSDPLRREIQKITGLELSDAAKDMATVVKLRSVGTVVQTFLLVDCLPSDCWGGTGEINFARDGMDGRAARDKDLQEMVHSSYGRAEILRCCQKIRRISANTCTSEMCFGQMIADILRSEFPESHR